MCVYVCVYTYVCIRMCVCMYMYVYVCECVRACVCVLMYVYVYLCTYVYVYSSTSMIGIIPDLSLCYTLYVVLISIWWKILIREFMMHIEQGHRHQNMSGQVEIMITYFNIHIVIFKPLLHLCKVYLILWGLDTCPLEKC